MTLPRLDLLRSTFSSAEAAAEQNLGYSTVTRWLRDFRNEGLPGLFPATRYPREPYTPDRVIVMLVYFKCLVPKVSERELARVIHNHPFQTRQQELFDPLWLRDPIAPGELIPMKTKPATPKASQLRLYFGPELLTRAS